MPASGVPPVIGRTLGHYRILEEIGKGGMGVVYRAHDERLDRDVALKVLPAGTLADEASRQRFRKEALALSKLNHPNIQTVHDFDTQDGLDFLVTEYVPGVTLNDRLAGKPLPEKEVLRLGQQLAEGLAAAHEQGIIHRDLKPSNLRVTPDGRLKILDFGVAKLLGPVSAPAATETGTRAMAGTPLYMSPEQRRGERVDARSDLYSAGLVLWEMATGKPPVAGRGLSGRVSPELQRIVEKCLEEERENRYQSAKELAVDLRRLASPSLPLAPSPQAPAWGRIGSRWPVPPGSAVLLLRVSVGLAAVAAVLAVLVAFNVGSLRERLFGASPPQIDSLAVLPLKNLMGDPEQDYFVEGMQEALITELSKISALKVISRTSTLRYKDTDKPLPQIARELNVAGVIEGSVLREGDQVRVTVQLIHGPSDRHLWAQSFDRELRGILALHSEVAQAIAREIKVTLTTAEETRLAGARPVNPETYQLYLQGRYFWNYRTQEGFEKAIKYFQQAIEKDPTNARAYAGLADCYNVLSNYLPIPSQETFPQAKAAALKALALDDTLAEPHASLAFVYSVYDWDWAAAEKEFQRAIELNPGYETAYRWYAGFLISVGRTEEGIAATKRALELDPVNMHGATAWHYYFAHRYDKAIEHYLKHFELHPGRVPAHFFLAQAYEQVGRYEEAIAEFQKAVAVDPDKLRALAGLAHAYALSGRRDEARKILDQLEEQAKRTYVSSYHLAAVQLALGDRDRAIEWLERAYQERSFWIRNLKVDPLFDSLRGDPRFQALLRRMNFPE